MICFSPGMTLREGNREYYYAALDRLFPGLSAEYRRRYGNRYEIDSPDAPALSRLFHETCERYGMLHDPDECFRFVADLPEKNPQISLFGV